MLVGVFFVCAHFAMGHIDSDDLRSMRKVGQRLEEEDVVACDDLFIANPKWHLPFYSVGVLCTFVALAFVCDEFFVPALEEMSFEHHLNLSVDVAGATLSEAPFIAGILPPLENPTWH